MKKLKDSLPADPHYKKCERVSSGQRKMIPDGNVDLHLRMNSIRNDSYVGKHKIVII